MTTFSHEEAGDTWPEKGLSRQAVINATGRSSSDDKGWLNLNYYPEAFESYSAGTNPLLQAGPDRSGDPTLVDDYATYPVSVLEGQTARDTLGSSIDSQVPIVTVTDEARDPTAKGQAEQWEGKRKSARLFLDAATDEELRTFNANLESYDSSEQDYAANMMMQEMRNLQVDKELKDSGGTGRYTVAEVSAMQVRVVYNEGVFQGVQAGVQMPTEGAPRSDVALENEVSEVALFEEITFDWNTTPHYMPRVTMPDFPLGVAPTQVYGMLYDDTNTYLTWVPFEQLPDGRWVSATGVSYISAAKTVSSNWRVAVAYQGTSSEFEVTERVYLVPPQVAESIVRFGGRT